MRSTLPTSHGFVVANPALRKRNPLGDRTGKSEFVNNFEFTGALDDTNWSVVPDAVKWREEVCGGEDAIINYNISLAKAGGKIVSEILGTEILDNAENTLTNCAMTTIRLPLEVGVFDAGKTVGWLQMSLVEEFDSFLPVFVFQGQFWTRLSAQVWVEEEDFAWAAEKLKLLCERAGSVEALKAVANGEQPKTVIGRANGTQTS